MIIPRTLYECDDTDCKVCAFRGIEQEPKRSICDVRLDYQIFYNNHWLVIMRGVTGSGKSTMARDIAGNLGVIHSTDDYFMKDDIYQFNYEKLAYYHFLNFMATLKSLEEKEPLIIIDNTNIKAEYARNYVDAAKVYGYKIIVREIVPYGLDIKYFLKYNTHNVNKESIEQMIKDYEPIDVFKEKLGIK